MSSTAAQDDRDVNAAQNILAAGHCRLAGGITFPLRLALPPKQCFVVAQVGEDVNVVRHNNTQPSVMKMKYQYHQSVISQTYSLA